MNLRILYLYIFLLFSISNWAMQVGDVLVVGDHNNADLPIHVAVLLSGDQEDNFLIGEANNVDGVKKYLLKDFMKKYSADQSIKVMRHIEFNNQENLCGISKIFMSHFGKNMEGHSYNISFVMNYEIDGLRTYYCSELVRELLNLVVQQEIPLHKMRFEKTEWDAVFESLGRKTPREELGVGPKDFLDPSLFDKVMVFAPKKFPRDNLRAGSEMSTCFYSPQCEKTKNLNSYNGSNSCNRYDSGSGDIAFNAYLGF